MKNARDHRRPNSGKKDWQWLVMSGCPDVLHMFDAQILLRVLPKHVKTIKADLAPGIRRPAHAELIKGGKSREASLVPTWGKSQAQATTDSCEVRKAREPWKAE